MMMTTMIITIMMIDMTMRYCSGLSSPSSSATLPSLLIRCRITWASSSLWSTSSSLWSSSSSCPFGGWSGWPGSSYWLSVRRWCYWWSWQTGSFRPHLLMITMILMIMMTMILITIMMMISTSSLLMALPPTPSLSRPLWLHCHLCYQNHQHLHHRHHHHLNHHYHWHQSLSLTSIIIIDTNHYHSPFTLCFNQKHLLPWHFSVSWF